MTAAVYGICADRAGMTHERRLASIIELAL